MYYIEQDNTVLLFDEDLQKLKNTINFCPQYKDLEIKETDRPIVDFEFADTEEWQEKQEQQERENQKAEIQHQLDELDKKRIRAICEGGENPQTHQTWLEYYNQQANILREQYQDLNN